MEHLIPVKKQGRRGLFQIFSRTTRGSAINENNNDVYGAPPDVAETAPAPAAAEECTALVATSSAEEVACEPEE